MTVFRLIFSAIICLRSCFAPTGICGLLAEKIAVKRGAFFIDIISSRIIPKIKPENLKLYIAHKLGYTLLICHSRAGGNPNIITSGL
jgi:hypothetical protein